MDRSASDATVDSSMAAAIDAECLFEHLLSVGNDLGLYSEEYDPTERRLLGNFPQAFTHVSLVNTAHNLSRAGGPAEHRAGTGSSAHARRST